MPLSSEIITTVAGALMLIIGLGLIIVPRFFYRHEAERKDLEKGIPVFVGIGMICIGLVPLLIGVLGLLSPYLR